MGPPCRPAASHQLLADPHLNKGTAFSRRWSARRWARRIAAALGGAWKPWSSMVARVWHAFQRSLGRFWKIIASPSLLQGQQIHPLPPLFSRRHIGPPCLPIVYTPTFGAAIQRFSLWISAALRLAFYPPPPGPGSLRTTISCRQSAGGPVDLFWSQNDAQGILAGATKGIGWR